MGNPNSYVEVGAITGPAARALKCKSAPIRFCEGFPGPKGYGRLHLESNDERMKAIKNMGFTSAEAFVRHVVTHWSRIVDGSGGRLSMVYVKDNYDLVVVVTYCAGGDDFWSVVTAIPKRVERAKVLLRREDLEEEATAG